jgi:hypothetical protein
VSGSGWLSLGVFSIVEAVVGHSVIGGNEQPVFLGVLVAALAFEAVWCLTHGTNAIGPISHPANPTGEAVLGDGVIDDNRQPIRNLWR